MIFRPVHIIDVWDATARRLVFDDVDGLEIVPAGPGRNRHRLAK